MFLWLMSLKVFTLCEKIITMITRIPNFLMFGFFVILQTCVGCCNIITLNTRIPSSFVCPLLMHLQICSSSSSIITLIARIPYSRTLAPRGFLSLYFFQACLTTFCLFPVIVCERIARVENCPSARAPFL